MTAPFGIALGSTPSASEAVYTVIFTNTPKFHPRFPVVVGQWTPESGLCQINGYTHWSDAGPYSLSIQSEYKFIKEQIAARYGDYVDMHDCAFPAARLDLFESASLPASTEIITGAAWHVDTGAQMPSDLEHIMLTIQALSDYEARICLTYAAFRDDLALSDML